ncbi:flagellar motor protein MotB [Sphingobium sp. AP49]|uniref:flagellar motor protein MotB n=1 Tax=Sphingobium sp. AP49 TaxID=1144307 RepID=UPI00026EE5BA|nr:flagellar motor protein MotB [Sphingobium sp. AP49]WHO38286.1 flagellar motor protein MotB [Sphingobium sp. AP49]
MTAPVLLNASAGRRNRWAVSFADLLLLLLGFFVLLQASGQKRDALLAEVSQQFGGRAMRQGIELRAAELFLPGEALLTPQGGARLATIAGQFARSSGKMEVRSSGMDRSHQRFDEWDLAAARLGAVARALKAAGISGDRLIIRGLDQADNMAGQGQLIRIAAGAAERH